MPRSTLFAGLLLVCLHTSAQTVVEAGAVFFEEQFDNRIDPLLDPRTADPNDWVSLSTDGATHWLWEEGATECGFGGYMRLPAGVETCPAGSLQTPLINVPACVPALKLTFYRQFREGRKQSEDVHLSAVDAAGNPVDLVMRSYTKTTKRPDCEVVTALFDTPDTSFRLAFNGPESCDGLVLDDIVLSAPDLTCVVTAPQSAEINVGVGQTVAFSGHADADLTPTYHWALKKAQALSRRKLYAGPNQEITFEEAGTYEAALIAHNGCVTAVSSFVRINVHASLVSITDPMTAARRPFIIHDVPSTRAFVGRVGDPQGVVHGIRWLRGTTVVCSETVTPGFAERETTCNIPFDERVRTAVSLQTVDADGRAINTRTVLVYAGLLLTAEVVSPEHEQMFDAGDTVLLLGEPLGPYAAEEDTTAYWLYKGRRYENGVNFTAQGHGAHRATFVVRNARLQAADQVTVNFWVQGRTGPPRIRIIQPHADWSIPPGGSLFFEASYGNLGPDERSVYWSIVNAQDEQLADGDQPLLGEVTFPEEGTYTARLYWRGEDGLQLVQSRTVWVRAAENGSDNPAEPAPLAYGKYDDLFVEGGNYFQTCVPDNGETIQVTVDFGTGAQLVFYPDAGEPVTQCVSGRKTLNLTGLAPGCYTWGIVPDAPECGTGATGKRGLSVSFSISVLSPALFFSDIVEDAQFSTEIGIVNPHAESTEITLLGYDNQGTVLSQTSREIPAMGTFRDTAANIFGDVADTVTWARVDSTTTLVGYSRTVSLDRLQSYAVGGAGYLQPELYVPHIAEDTQTWYTKAKVINGQENEISAQLITRNAPQSLTNEGSFSKDDVDFLERLGGTITNDNNWASFKDMSEGPNLAGNEIFGTIDGTSQIVGLGLAGSVADNPNFTNGSDKLYFTHITDSSDFWTGIAFVNRADVEQGVLINAYAPSGTLVDSGTLTLGPFAKHVKTASGTLADAGISPTGVGWLEVAVDPEVTGYELFGTLTGGNRLAGIEAITEVRKNICFPFVDSSGSLWHGVAVVNVTSAAALVDFTLRSETGEVVACVEGTPLAAKQKQIFTLTGLFGTVPAGAAWLEVKADRELVGFEIFGDEQNEHMSGLIAR